MIILSKDQAEKIARRWNRFTKPPLGIELTSEAVIKLLGEEGNVAFHSKFNYRIWIEKEDCTFGTKTRFDVHRSEVGFKRDR